MWVHCPRRGAALLLVLLEREPSMFGEGGTTCDLVSKGRVMILARLCSEVMARSQEIRIDIEVIASVGAKGRMKYGRAMWCEKKWPD